MFISPHPRYNHGLLLKLEAEVFTSGKCLPLWRRRFRQRLYSMGIFNGPHPENVLVEPIGGLPLSVAGAAPSKTGQ